MSIQAIPLVLNYSKWFLPYLLVVFGTVKSLNILLHTVIIEINQLFNFVT